eukprot:gene1159-10673_t
MERQPCPERIVDDVGSAFSMGFVGGSIFHYIKGAKDSPKGEKFSGAWKTMKLRGPILGGNFAVWGGLFSSFDCLFQHYRKKEDIWNPIVAGFCTGGVLSLRGGVRAALRSALFGGIFIGVIEGASSFVQKMIAQTQMSRMVPPPPPSGLPPRGTKQRDNEFNFIPN